MLRRDLTSGDGGGIYEWGTDPRTLPGFEAFKQGTYSPSDTVRDNDGAMVDGVESPSRDGNVRGSTSSSDRTPGVQAATQWGFGDPGLRSRGSAFYNPALQNLSPTGILHGGDEQK